MTGETKITLSAKEQALVCNTDWILTKHAIIDKVYRLFGIVAADMQQFICNNRHNLNLNSPGVWESNPKISKGENYQHLPYVMLDYPRYFTRDTTLAIRTFFWWGNFISINLQLSGELKDNAIPALTDNFPMLQKQNYWLCVNSDPWQHHFSKENFVLLKECTAEEFSDTLNRKPFVKIATKISIEHWDNASIFIEQSFKEIVTLLMLNYPNGEKDLLPGIPIAGFDL